MNVVRRTIVVSPLALSLSTTVLAAQDPKIEVSHIRTLAQGLAAGGITDLSEQSLTAALTNGDPAIRNLAANKLAEDHHEDAIPAIESALAREPNLNTQIGLSEALWSLHDGKGIEHLHAMCMDPSLNFMTMVSVVDALSLTHSPAGMCAETFSTAMARTKETGEIAMGTTRLAVIYRDASPERRSRIITTLRLLLADAKQEPSVRMESSQALSDIGTPECAEAIRAAIAQEPNPDFRTFFEATLKGLEKRNH